MSAAKLPTVSEVLTRAAGLVEKGWCQHRFCDLEARPARYCPLGAIHHVVSSRSEERGVLAKNALRSVIARDDIASWNDAKGRRKADVVKALRKAAESAR